jgi:hypothetical protein
MFAVFSAAVVSPRDDPGQARRISDARRVESGRFMLYGAPMNAPRDHHFIPAFYLKQWAGPDGKLIEYTRKGGKLIPKPVGPRSTGYERDLYAFPELPPDAAQFMEQVFFAYADQKASRRAQQPSWPRFLALDRRTGQRLVALRHSIWKVRTGSCRCRSAQRSCASRSMTPAFSISCAGPRLPRSQPR